MEELGCAVEAGSSQVRFQEHPGTSLEQVYNILFPANTAQVAGAGEGGKVKTLLVEIEE